MVQLVLAFLHAQLAWSASGLRGPADHAVLPIDGESAPWEPVAQRIGTPGTQRPNLQLDIWGLAISDYPERLQMAPRQRPTWGGAAACPDATRCASPEGQAHRPRARQLAASLGTVATLALLVALWSTQLVCW